MHDRIAQPDTRLRRSGADYLAYALLDAVVDSYFSYLYLDTWLHLRRRTSCLGLPRSHDR